MSLPSSIMHLIVGKADDPPAGSDLGRTGSRGPGAELRGALRDGRGESSRHP